jgi:hypothetical protein
MMWADPEKLRRLRRVLGLIGAGIAVLLLVSCWFHVGLTDGRRAVYYGGAKVLVWRGQVTCPTTFDAGIHQFEFAIVPVIDLGGRTYYIVSVPIWPVLGLCLVATWWVRRREVLARRDACHGCGYDRRGLATDTKCPECGMVPTE